LFGLLQNYLAYGGVGFSAEAIAELITVVTLIVSFVLFLFLAVRFRHSESGILGSFKLQLSIAILVWIVGEVFAYTNYMADWSMYVHTCSMALFALFLVYRVRALAGK
jgi:hypothetical protein